jgi:hypothetical protein
MSQDNAMKTKSFFIVLAATVHLQLFAANQAKENYIAHEWGTFTSVQGADGVLLEWNPFVTPELPSFVYDYKKPSGAPLRQLALFGGKDAFRALQRMETPVIYFYSETERSVDVTVKFPQGRITEWYPQARDIGPSIVQPRPVLAALDNTANQIGLPGVNLSSIDTKKSIYESLIRWSDVKIFPARQHEKMQTLMPGDGSGSHYYAARETDADFLRVSARVNDTDKPEYEKLLFYRGVGNFATPLKVTLGAGGEEQVFLRNTGDQPLSHLFVLHMRNGAGQFLYVDRVAAGTNRVIQVDQRRSTVPVSDLVNQISEAMRLALVKEGLYEREAAAMVKTWKDSWFEEQGLRVLYVLPRTWTDRVLPLTLDPQPQEVVRVMVGRAEVITPAMEWNLLKQIVRYSEADTATREHVVQETRKLGLGRFTEPATRRLMTRLSSVEFNNFASQLLQAASKAEKPAKTLAQK